MIIEIYRIYSLGESPSTGGKIHIIRECSTENIAWRVDRQSQGEPWDAGFEPSSPLWALKARPLINVFFEAGRRVWVKIQAPEKQLKREQVARGFCSTKQGGKVVEGPWEATRITGESWSIQFKENPPEPWLKNEVAKFIEAVLNAAQAN